MHSVFNPKIKIKIKLTILFEIAPGIEGVGVVGWRRRWDLKRIGFYDVGGARAYAEQVGVRNDAE